MSLHEYGVAIGTVNHYVRDTINDYGQYYHENLYIDAEGTYRCAIDVDTKGANDGIQWRVVPMRASELKGVDLLPNGWHVLASNPSSGAIDNIRTEAFHRSGCMVAFFRYDPVLERLRQIFNFYNNPPWTAGTSIEALTVFEPLLVTGRKVFVFGEPFTHGGLGVHNIHQNQGDPAGSHWWTENGIWQDGCTIIQTDANSYTAFVTKFKTQSELTDTSGHPI